MHYECTYSSVGHQGSVSGRTICRPGEREVDHYVYTDRTASSSDIALINHYPPTTQTHKSAIVCIDNASINTSWVRKGWVQTVNIIGHLGIWIEAKDQYSAIQMKLEQKFLTDVAKELFPEVDFREPWDLLTVRCIEPTQAPTYRLEQKDAPKQNQYVVRVA